MEYVLVWGWLVGLETGLSGLRWIRVVGIALDLEVWCVPQWWVVAVSAVITGRPMGLCRG